MTISIMVLTKNNKLKRLLGGTFALLFWVLVWQLVATLVGREVILPAPLSVLKRFFELAKTSLMWRATALSLVRIMSGYLLGALAGGILGAAMYFSKGINVIFSPFLTFVKSTPVASFILIAYFMITNTAIPLFITFLMVLPMMASSVYTSLSSADTSLLEMAKVYKLSFGKRLKALYVPTALPHFLGQAVVALGLGWKAGVAAEVLCTPKDSIGKYLYDSKVYLDSHDMFAYTMLIVIISLLLENLLRFLTRKLRGGAA